MKIAVFASHSGSDMQAIVDGCKNGKIAGKVCAVISNNSDAFVLKRAKKENISSYFVNAKLYPEENGVDNKILEILGFHKIDMIFLAGYLKLLGKPILQKYRNMIFNIHPALLPKFGGKGMYGMNVHKAVIEAKEKDSGITIHRVNEEYDTGEIIAQTQVPVFENDTPKNLAERIFKEEHIFLVDVINDIIEIKQISDSIAPCGLVCKLCQFADSCGGCKSETNCCGSRKSDEGCYQYNCCEKKRFDGCWQCEIAPCNKGMFSESHDVRLRAFITYIKRNGKDKLADRLYHNAQNGVHYGHGKDYDNLDSINAVIERIEG